MRLKPSSSDVLEAKELELGDLKAFYNSPLGDFQWVILAGDFA